MKLLHYRHERMKGNRYHGLKVIFCRDARGIPAMAVTFGYSTHLFHLFSRRWLITREVAA